MDGQRFDDIARALTSAASRRRVLRALVAGVFGGAGIVLGGKPAEAAICRNGTRSYGSFCTDSGQCRTGYCFKPGNGNNRCLCRNVREAPCGGECRGCCGEGQACFRGACQTCSPTGIGCVSVPENC